MNDNRLYVRHVLDCIDAISEYTQGITNEQGLLADRKTFDAVMRRLHIMVESLQRLEEKAKARLPDFPWHALKNFRNILVHEYLGIDVDRIWPLLTKELPELKNTILKNFGDIL